MNQYPSNSDRAMDPNVMPEQPSYANRRVQQPVVQQGAAKRQEKRLIDDVLEFFGLSECRNFREYVGAVSDMTNRVYGAVDTLIGNRNGNNPYPYGYYGASVPGARIAYSDYYRMQNPQPQPQTQPQRNYGYDNLEFATRADAETVLFQMGRLIQMYRSVSVGDLFDLAGVTSPNGYVDQNYGWTDVSNARVMPYRGQYRITGLPAPMPL